MERFSYSRNGDNGLVDQNCQVRVQIPAIDTVGKHVTYMIRVTNIETRQSWEVTRRFSEFLKIRNELLAYFAKEDQKKCPGCVNYEKVIRLFEFPRKHIFTSVSPAVLNYRKVALRSFVALLASHTFTTTPKCPTCSGFAFTAVQEFLTQELKATPPAGTVARSDEVPLTPDAIRESMDVRKFTNYHPAAKLRQVDSTGKFMNTSGRKNREGKPRIQTTKTAAGTHDGLPSPPHSSTGSSSGSFSNPPSPVAAPAVRRQEETNAQEDEQQPADEGSFVSFTGSASRPKRSSRASRSSAKGSRRAQGDNSPHPVVVPTKKKSEKKRLNFARKQAASPRHSMESAGDDEHDDQNADVDDEEFGSINLDFLKNVSVAN